MKISQLLVVLALFVILLGPVLAVTFDGEPVRVELRSDLEDNYNQSIEARDNDVVDIRMAVVLNASGTGGNTSGVNAYAEIWGLQENNNWVFVDQTSTEFQTFSSGEERNFFWPNAFIVSDEFEEYRVDGFAKASSENTYEKESGFITNVRPAVRCSDIEVQSRSLVIDESDSETIVFDVRNEGDQAFSGAIVSFVETDDDLTIERLNSFSTIEPNEVQSIQFRVRTDSVDDTKTVPVTVHVSGRFDDKFCSGSEIGPETFSVRIDDRSGVSLGACDDVRLTVFPAIVPQNSSVLKGFFISNQRNERFLVSDIQAQTNGGFLSVFKESVDPSVSAFASASGLLRLVSGSVTNNQTQDVFVRIKGEFEDGPSCDFSQTLQAVFPVTIEPSPRSASCSELRGEIVPVRIGENDVSEFAFHLQNNSGNRFDIDELEVNENSSDLTVEDLFVPSSVSANQVSEIRLRAQTNDLTESEQLVLGSVRVRGEFQNGLDCGLSDVVSPLSFELSSDLQADFDAEEDAFCSDIQIQTRDVTLAGGESISKEFFVENNSNDTFFLDGIEAFDYSNGVIVEPGIFDGFVRENDQASIFVGISADSTNTPADVTGFVRVRGHFSDDRTCSSNAIGRETFSVHVNPGNQSTPTQPVCNQIQVNVPSVISASAPQTVSFSVQNPTNQTVLLVLRGAHLTVSPNSFSVLPNSNPSFSVLVQNTSNENTKLEYQLFSENCQSNIYYSNVLAARVAGLDGTIQIVQAPTALVFVQKTTVVFSVQNKSQNPQTIQSRLEGFPSKWLTDSLSTRFEPFETKIVSLDVLSNGQFGLFSGQIVVQSPGQRLEVPLQLNAIQVLGLGSDFTINTTATPVAPDSFEIKTTIQSSAPQQVRGTVFLETENGAVLQQHGFILNPNTTQTVTFQFKPSLASNARVVRVRTTLEDGRTDLQTIALQDPQGGFDFGTVLVLLGADSLTFGLALILVLLILAAIATAKPKPLHAPIKTVVVPVAPPSTVVVEKTVIERVEKAPGSANGNRFWFLKS